MPLAGGEAGAVRCGAHGEAAVGVMGQQSLRPPQNRGWRIGGLWTPQIRAREIGSEALRPLGGLIQTKKYFRVATTLFQTGA